MKLFEETDEVRDAIASLWDKFGDYDRGTLIFWADIEKVISFPHRSNEGEHIIMKWRRQVLATRGIAMRPQRGVGLRLLSNIEQTTECAEDRQRRAHRQCNRALNEVGAVDGSSLNVHYRRLQNATMDTIRYARKQVRRGVKEVMMAMKSHPIKK